MKTPQQSKPGLGIQHTLVLCMMAIVSLSGCAAFTNPVANGIPVRRIPEDLLAESKEQYQYIPLGLLQRTPPKEIIIAPEDVVGVYVVGVLGDENQLPPVQLPTADVPPAIGFPIPVQADGTIPLPLIDDPKIAGLTVEAAQKLIYDMYTGLDDEKKKKLLQPDQSVILTMIRPKHVRVVVIRQDSLGSRQQQFVQTQRGFLANPLTNVNRSQQGAGFELEIPANEADILSALAETGGFPGLDAKNEILVYRKKDTPENFRTLQELRKVSEPTRIPLKVREGELPTLAEEDIMLHDGDILVVETREPEQYYTAGLMINQEVPLPYDTDLTVVEAVTRVGGPVFNGGFGGSNLQGSIVQSGIGNPNPTLLTVLRQAPNGQQIPIRVDLAEAVRDPRENILVMDNDILILQETPGEAFARYISGIFDFGLSANYTRRNGVTVRTLSGAASVIAP